MPAHFLVAWPSCDLLGDGKWPGHALSCL